MALSGVNYALVNSEPSSKIPAGEVKGGVKVLYDSHTFAASVNAIGQTILIGSLLPKGARVVNAWVKSPSLGTTGILSFGWQASADAVEAADADGFLVATSIDAGGQAVLGTPTLASAGIGKQFAAAVQPYLIFTEASDVAIGLTIQACIEYVMD